ncbi:MAG: response regulator transcription factor [Chloroflexi bacterium]|nr:response regulator transcription factor [Chloroflexota bacterium]
MTRGAQPPRQPGAARLVIVDDHDLARAGLRSLLTGEHDLEVVGEAANGREALGLCRRLQPDLVFMDVRMPDLDGLAATRAIKQICPGTNVIIVTMHEHPDYLFEALKAGAAGYVLKGATRRQIVEAARQALSGAPLLPAELAPLLRRLADQTASPPGHLTSREREVLRVLARGRTNPEIGRELGLSVNTVKAHVEHILAKLGASDRTQAAVRARELGLLSIESTVDSPQSKGG